MKTTDNLEEAIKKNLNFAAGAELHDQMLDDVLNAQEESKRAHSAVTRPNLRRQIMKSPIIKVGAAAAIIVVSFAGFFLLKETGSGIALADVLNRMEQIEAYECRMSTSFGIGDMDEKPISQTSILTSPLGVKINIEIDHPITGQAILQEIYVMPPKKTITTLMPNEKKYSQLEFDEAAFKGWRKESDPRALVEKVLDCEHKRLGESTIDGIKSEGFQTTDQDYLGESIGQAEITIWVDAQTRLPVRMEVDKSEENKGHAHITIHDFRWDVPFDASEFEPVIPDDYTPGRPMLQILPGKQTPPQ